MVRPASRAHPMISRWVRLSIVRTPCRSKALVVFSRKDPLCAKRKVEDVREPLPKAVWKGGDPGNAIYWIFDLWDLADRVALLLVRALHPWWQGAPHHGPRYSRVLGFEPPEIV